MSRRELLACVLLLAIGIALLPLVGGGVLWTHPLWLDELCCTIYPTEQPSSPVAVIANIAHRQDFAPPLLHLIVWTVGRAAGGMTPVLLRSLSLASVSLALIFVYAALRRRSPVAASVAGALAIASHPLVLTHAFEGRFYGPWLLIAAAYAWAAGGQRKRDAVLQGVFAVCLVTIHWFGVISLGLMATGIVASYGRRWRDGLKHVLPSATGLLALVLCLPLLTAQRAGSSSFLWIPALTSAQVMGIARVFFITAVPVVAAAVLVLETLSSRPVRLAPIATTLRAAFGDPAFAALGSLALMPVALILVSVVLQPSLIDRYAIVTVLAWAPLVALALTTAGRAGSIVALVLLVLPFTRNLQAAIGERQAFAELVRSNSAAYDQAAALNVPIIFPDLHTIYPVLGPTHLTATRARVLDIPDSTLQALYPSPRLAWMRQRTRAAINSARSHNRIYGFPTVVSTADLAGTPRFVLLASDLRLPGGVKQSENWGHIVFPTYRVTRINETLSLFERAP